MTKKLERLMKVTAFASILSIVVALIMGVVSESDQNLKLLTSSLFPIVQSALVLTYIKMFRKIGGK